ncbi:isocitrate lyase/phosphoenolpyruvate mutase family protein [Sphingopyxis sp. BSN-002]|uniref:isocitrate lyase/PEP mutase family protein n=1 Tax=Sphingopyxis sp. BSN-002 TaxID=2911495 RepID=UPI001EDB091A|nr:isocitrate lyase/phosphoenolpyruvate mutase family protein [Sphingopyxis sp. BSN-002]UKK83459.1 isocitrate lyase/phosphoenolpyruvate mutase family protein [Sphingopyxis sp. BSN-002]
MTDKVAEFRALHVPGDPLILVNIWDAGSAKAVAAAGAKAIATGSYGVAGAQGRNDGEDFPLEDVFENLGRILSVTDLPVTIDMESGYGADPAAVGVSVGRAFDAGAAGINMEDRLPGESALLPIAGAQARYRAAADTGIFINARCDTFRGQDAAKDGEALVAATLERARAYADAGAGSLFVPFLLDPKCIGAICEGSPLPVNILRGKGGPTHRELASLGVARISHGHQPWAAAMAWLTAEAGRVFGGDEPGY